MKKKGRKPTTGRFTTREELCAHVWFLYDCTSCSVERIANNCKVSHGTVSRIIDTKEGYPAPQLIAKDS